MAQPISPDSYAMMIATIKAGDLAGSLPNGDSLYSAAKIVDMTNDLLKAADLEVGDYRNYSPGYNAASL